MFYLIANALLRLGASTIYDVVACNWFYNRLMWGYSIKDYSTLCKDTLDSSSEGWALDLACGSLAFTAEVYSNCSNRPVVFLDQSLRAKTILDPFPQIQEKN